MARGFLSSSELETETPDDLSILGDSRLSSNLTERSGSTAGSVATPKSTCSSELRASDLILDSLTLGVSQEGVVPGGSTTCMKPYFAQRTNQDAAVFRQDTDEVGECCSESPEKQPQKSRLHAFGTGVHPNIRESPMTGMLTPSSHISTPGSVTDDCANSNPSTARSKQAHGRHVSHIVSHSMVVPTELSAHEVVYLKMLYYYKQKSRSARENLWGPSDLCFHCCRRYKSVDPKADSLLDDLKRHGGLHAA
ncbi:hypothetical protein TGPRC2_260400 [Toxoplasma gondii TgCatPRC2]|uniref:Uncharacterized protein n=1 Tax=Toxoplasma gondii TgCatPRC2 TaxID=1130821 RepID=A0A151HM92_TOXGO|nr:hypothetical protein TGPRC2_260400 [Toxoplasma gondii TgCatPRC2]